MKGENSAQPAAGKGGESRMTGKDLFAALSFVDDALILEAEEAKPARRAFPAQAVRWGAALAACVCLLVGWAFAAERLRYAGSTSNETAGAAEGAVQEAGGMPETAEDSADAGFSGKIIDRYLGENEMVTCYAAPQNGTWTIEQPLQDMLDRFAGEDVRFLVAFDLFAEETRIDPADDAYAREAERLAAAGYDLRILPQESAAGETMRVCGLFTAEQLEQFDAADAYGYDFYFPKNADGTPLDWNEPAGEPAG